MTKRLLMNVLLTLVWVALTGNFSFINFVFGFLLSFMIMWFMSRGSNDRKYFRRIPKFINFIFYFIYELCKANIQVAMDVITPRLSTRPGIVKIPLSAKTNLEIAMLSNVITLTPGTLVLDVSDDKKVLYVHGMFIRNQEEFVRNIKEGFERRIIDILR